MIDLCGEAGPRAVLAACPYVDDRISWTRPPRHRRRGAVATTSALLADGKIQSYLEGIAFGLALVLYFVIRKSCRLIAEAPAELLDERLVEIRNQTYVIAYAILAFTVGIAIGVVWASDLAWTSEVISEPILDRGMITPFVMAFFMLGILLPNMVLAWNLPSENQP